MTDVIYSDPSRDLEVRLDTQAPADLLELLETTVWGQRGVAFRSLDMAEMLQDLASPSFLRLVKGDRTIAAAVRNRKRVEIAGTPHDAIHLALFAVHHDFAGQGFGKVLAEVSRAHYLNLLSRPGLLYGYIESGNEASLRLNLGLGYRDLGEMHFRIFSRARPRVTSCVEALGQEGRQEVLDRLKATYATHALCSFGHSLDPERYFVVRRRGEIVAGAQVHILHWELLRLPGWHGRLILNLLPHIPLLGRDFTPADLRFARVGNLYAENGSEPLIAEILETVLARQHLPFADVLLDPRGEPELRILNAIDFGVLDRAIAGKFHLVAEFKGVGGRELEELCQAPVIISPEDPL